MIMIFAGALVIAGLFTFVPGRIMHAVVFGHLGERQKQAFGGRFSASRDMAVPAGRRLATL